MSVSTTSLFSTFKNPAGTGRFYGYLSTHGMYLAAGASVSFIGDPVAAIRRGTLAEDTKILTAFNNDVANSLLQVTATPATILIDTVTSASKAIVATSGALGVALPSFG
jgi:hypothetical protein